MRYPFTCRLFSLLLPIFVNYIYYKYYKYYLLYILQIRYTLTWRIYSLTLHSFLNYIYYKRHTHWFVYFLLRLFMTSLIKIIVYRRTATLTSAEDLANVGSPLREASPRPEVRVVAPSHRPPPALATVNNTNNASNGSANRKSVSILLPEQSSGWPEQQHGFVHRCDKEPPSI